MKQLLLALIVILAMSSCTKQYIAKDKDGAPIIIYDREGIIEDAFKLKVDSIYVVKYTRGKTYTPLRWMGKEQTTFWTDTLTTGKVISGAHTYRKLKLSQVYER